MSSRSSSWSRSQLCGSGPLLQPAIVCKKGSAFVPVSLELFEDSGIVEELGRLLADAKLVPEGLAFTISQTNGPVGIITALVAAGGSTVIATGTNVLAQGDLYVNQAALPARWHANAKWMMNLSILNGYRQLPETTGLNYSIVDDSGDLPKALGWPIYENSSMDGSLIGAAADYAVLSGDSPSTRSSTGSGPASSSCRTSSGRTIARRVSAGSTCTSESAPKC